MKQHETIQSSGRLAFPVSRDPLPGAAGLAGVFQAGETSARKHVERSIAYMMEHLNKPLQVATLAALANVSPSHFFTLFKQRVGCPPMGYFTRLRMHHARRLLGSTSASVKEAAAALGYDDPFYFSRVFKSVNKIAPSAWRRQSRGGELANAGWSAGRPAVPDLPEPDLQSSGARPAGGQRRRLPLEKTRKSSFVHSNR
jgi:AraC-like DNA-binding protein